MVSRKLVIKKELEEMKAEILQKILQTISEKIEEEMHDGLCSIRALIKKDLYQGTKKIVDEIAKTNNTIRNLDFVFKTINVKKQVDAEDYAKGYYLKHGWDHVIKTRDYLNSTGIIRSLLNEADFYAFCKERTGIPDLIALSKSNKYKFLLIEVKTNLDGLRKNQLAWIKKHRSVPIVIFHLDQKIYGDIQ